MIKINKKIDVELTKPNIFQAIVAKQYDMNTRFLDVTLKDDGNRVDIPNIETVKVIINAERPDGLSLGFEGVINDDGTVTVPLEYDMLELDGTVICDISVIDTDPDNPKKLTTTSFTLMVEKAAYGGDDVTSDPQYDVLVQLLEDCSKAGAAAEEARSETEMLHSETLKIYGDMESLANIVKDDANSAAISSHDALNYSLQAEEASKGIVEYAEAAENSAARAEAAAENMPIDVWQCVYANNSLEWVSHDESNVDPYESGKDVLFTAVKFEKDKKYKLQFDLKPSSAEYDYVYALVTVANSTNNEDRISAYTLCEHNSKSGHYELEFIASRTVEANEQLMIFVQYPETHLGDKDYNAIYSSVYILYENHIKTVVAQNSEEIKVASSKLRFVDNKVDDLIDNWLYTDGRVSDLEDAIGDIEAALDGIITLQGNLIGGGN